MGNQKSSSTGKLHFLSPSIAGGRPENLTSARLEVSRSHRILWLLEEIGINYELKTYKRTKAGLAPPGLKEVHPLGKSPVLTIEPPGSTTPIVLAESAAITEYLCDYFGKWLVPQRYRDGKDGQIGGETESWLRFRMLMHYAEGSLMPFMLLGIVVQSRSTQDSSDIQTHKYRNQKFARAILHQANHQRRGGKD